MNSERRHTGESLKEKRQVELKSIFLFLSFTFTPFKVGEKLIFDVSYGPFKAGEMILEVMKIDTLRGKEVYKFHLSARTTGTFSYFFKVADDLYSYVTTDSFFTLRYEKYLKEGKFTTEAWIDYYPQGDSARYPNGKSYPIPHGALDPLSVYYYIRTKHLKPGDTLRVPFHVDRRSRMMKIIVLDYRKFRGMNCIVLKPDFKEANIIKSGGEMEVWLQIDEKKIPLQLRSKLFFGTLKAVLRDYVPSTTP